MKELWGQVTAFATEPMHVAFKCIHLSDNVHASFQSVTAPRIQLDARRCCGACDALTTLVDAHVKLRAMGCVSTNHDAASQGRSSGATNPIGIEKTNYEIFVLVQILEITLPIFLIVSIGFFYSKAVKPDFSDANRLIVDIALPILIFTSLSNRDFDPAGALVFAAAAALHILLSGLIALPFARASGTQWRAFLPCVMFTNVGPVGIPLIVLAFGPEGLPIAVVLLVLSNILHFTLGAGLMSGRIEWRTLFANPLVWATVLGVSFAQFDVQLPAWLDTPLLMIGNILVPMMLLSLGARLSTSQIKDAAVGVKGAILTTGLRLIACYSILLVIPLDGIERGAFILYACMPSAVFNYMLADKYKTEPNKVASMVVVGHFASIAFLPLGIWLALQ